MARPRPCAWLLALLPAAYAILSHCQAECALSKRDGLCPVRDGPMQVFDGTDRRASDPSARAEGAASVTDVDRGAAEANA